MPFKTPMSFRILLACFLYGSSAICHVLASDRTDKAEIAVVNLSNRDPEIQRKALMSLLDQDQIGVVPDSALEPLLVLVKSKDSIIRARAVQALGILGSAYLGRTEPIFISALDDEHDVAVEAAIATGRLKIESSVPRLSKMSERKDPVERHFAADALSRIGTTEARAAYLKYVAGNLPALIDELDSNNMSIAADADVVISRINAGLKKLGLQDTPEGRAALTAKEIAQKKSKERWSREFGLNVPK